MFGHQDDKPTDNQNNHIGSSGQMGVTADDDLGGFVGPVSQGGSSNDHPSPDAWHSSFNAFGPNNGGHHDHTADKDVLSPAGGYPEPPSSRVQAGSSDDDDSSSGDLIDIKQHALDELLPLINKLDQTPEEKFKTLMMMIQASDNQALIEAAYKAAHEISNEKDRAQALLDIVNEINYFTQQPEN
jgi:hypothetical protein